MHRQSRRAHRIAWTLCTMSVIAPLLALIVPGVALAHPVTGAPGCALFPSDNPWNQRIDDLPVAAGSSRMLRAMELTSLHADFSDSDADGYGIPYNVVDAATPTSTVQFDYADESDSGPYPIPASPLIEPASDRHILMLQRDSCTLYELYAAEFAGGQWTAGSGAIWNLGSNALRPAGWTSADAAGLPILPGLVRHEDLEAGGIDHAMRITLPVTQRAYLWPARHHASDNRSPAEAPMGLRIRIRSTFPIATYSPQTQAVLRAGQQYGFIVADNGSAGYITGAPDPGWDDDDLHELQSIPATACEVVDVASLPGTPTRRRAWNSKISVGQTVVRGHLFQSRAGNVRLVAIRNHRVVRSRKIFARQGYVRVSIRRAKRASYRITLV